MKQHLGPILMVAVALFIVGGCIHNYLTVSDEKSRQDGKSTQGDKQFVESGVKGRRVVDSPQGKKTISKEEVKGPPKVTPSPTQPDKTILFQPKFIYEDNTTYQGTGFFARAPNGNIAAVTSSHFLRQEGAPLVKAEWLDIRADKTVARFSKSWGLPGSGGNLLSLRSDYLLMPVEQDIPGEMILELDPRALPLQGERIWFPNKDPDRALGYDIVPGKVTNPVDTGITILLDRPITVQSQSGSPVISQATGKVLGTLSRAFRGQGRTTLQFCPSRAIIEALENNMSFPALHSVVGKPAAPDLHPVAPVPPDRRELKTLKGHRGVVVSVAYSPHGKTLASGSGDKTVKIWDPTTGKELLILKGHSDLVFALAYSPDSKSLATGSYDGIKLWEVSTGEELATLNGHIGSVYSLAFSPNGKTLASAGRDGTIKLWDMTHHKEKSTLKGHTDWVYSIAFHPDGKMLASGSEDGTIKLWNVETRTAMSTFNGETGRVLSVAFSPDGITLASGGGATTINLWNPMTGHKLALLKGHQNAVKSVMFNSDGKTLASGSTDHTVKLWDRQTGKELATLKGHNSLVAAVSFSPDGKFLASGSEDGTIKLWDVRLEK
jgi:WD40 repeat protein